MKYQNQLYLTIALLFSTSLFALGFNPSENPMNNGTEYFKIANEVIDKLPENEKKFLKEELLKDSPFKKLLTARRQLWLDWQQLEKQDSRFKELLKKRQSLIKEKINLEEEPGIKGEAFKAFFRDYLLKYLDKQKIGSSIMFNPSYGNWVSEPVYAFLEQVNAPDASLGYRIFEWPGVEAGVEVNMARAAYPTMGQESEAESFKRANAIIDKLPENEKKFLKEELLKDSPFKKLLTARRQLRLEWSQLEAQDQRFAELEKRRRDLTKETIILKDGSHGEAYRAFFRELLKYWINKK